MFLRRFTPQGVERFRSELELMGDDPSLEPPRWMLASPEFTEEHELAVDVAEEHFGTRADAARRLNEILGDPPPPDVFGDVGLWAWLTLFYIDSVLPLEKKGGRAVKAIARYIPDGADYRRYYRHLLAGPYRVFRAHRDAPERAAILLCPPVSTPGDVVEQLVARQELITNPIVVQVATSLYYDPKSGTAKKGAGGKAGGSARRLASVLDQFDVTWDLFALPWEDLIERLPKEFSRFRPAK
jgi:hypothetical protein